MHILTVFLRTWRGNARSAAHRQSMASIENYILKSGAVRYRVRYLTPDNTSTDKGGFATKAEATAWMHDMETRKMSGIFISNSALKTPMGALIEEYIALTAGPSRSTIAQRRSHADNWLLPQWRDWPVGRVTKRAVEEWIERMSASGAGAATVQKVHQLLVSVMKRAVDANLIPSNPVRNVRLPRMSKARHPYLTYNEIAELAEAIDPRYRALVSLLALTGLRFGEAAALRVSAVDLDKRLVHVVEAVTEVGGVVEFGPTKTHENRVVAFPQVLAEQLRLQMIGKRPESLLFASPDGHTLRLVTWRRRYWHPALVKINAARRASSTDGGVDFPKVTPHDLRHTAASLAVRGGASVVGVQRMLGHADAKMTLNTYVGLFRSDLTAVADVLNESANGSRLARALNPHADEPVEA